MTTQDTKIPDDILDAAKDIAEQPWLTRAERDRMTLQIAKAILAERQRCEGDFSQVGWVHSIPNPRFGIETFFSVGKPQGNVHWIKAYARRSDFTTSVGDA